MNTFGGILSPEEQDCGQFLTEHFQWKPKDFGFKGRDPYGDSYEASPVWVRPASLSKDGISILHIVGHTRVKNINLPKEDSNMILIDTSGRDYLEYNNGEFKIHNL